MSSRFAFFHFQVHVNITNTVFGKTALPLPANQYSTDYPLLLLANIVAIGAFLGYFLSGTILCGLEQTSLDAIRTGYFFFWDIFRNLAALFDDFSAFKAALRGTTLFADVPVMLF